MDLKNLQNGSDIRGVAINSIENEPVNLSQEIAVQLGFAFAKWISYRHEGSAKIGIGMDPRLSGPELKQGLFDGLLSFGAIAVDFGLATTPAVFMSTQFKETSCDASIMITASHLPSNRNGFKFFTKNGGLDKKDIKEIIEIAENTSIEKVNSNEIIPQINLIELYSKYLIDTIKAKTKKEKPLNDLHIIVDAGNGSGGFFAEDILSELGANTEGSLFLDPNGTFPNHAPNPEDRKAIGVLQDQVLKTNADLGIIFDTDVDRAAIVSSSGKPINRNALIALISAILLEEHPGSTIVTDSVTSTGLQKFIEKKGGIHHRFKRGYRNVINEGIRLNNIGKECWLAIETSGHGAMRENYFLDDGAFLIAKLLIKYAQINEKGQNLEQIIENLEEPKDEKEIRLKILDANFGSYGQKVIEDLKDYVSKTEGWEAEKVNHEGFRVNCLPNHGDGWFLLRLSLHDPVLPLNIESNIKGGSTQILNGLTGFLKKYDQLETSSLI